MSDPLAVKFVDGTDNILEGLAIPFGKDLQGEDFGPDTDLALDWFPEEGRPVLYHHGLDPEIKTALVGRQVEREPRDIGHWVKVQLDKRSKYLDALHELVDADGLRFSSGSVPHLVQTTKAGHLERWPWVELSLTPTPAHPGANVYAVKMADAIDHLAAVKAVPDALKQAIEESWDGAHVTLTLADHAQRVLAELTALTERSQDIAALRGKAGRRISSATRERLAAVRDQAKLVIRDLDDLLTDPEQESETGKALAAEQVRWLREQARINGVAV